MSQLEPRTPQTEGLNICLDFFFFFLKGDIFALIMLIILQVSAFPGLLQNSGIYNLSDSFLL